MGDNDFSSSSRYKYFEDRLNLFKKEFRLRMIPDDMRGSLGYDLTSNDYLGFGKLFNPDDFLRSLKYKNFSSSASRLLSRYQSSYAKLENLLSGLYNKSVLLFNSGYHANVGIIESLAVDGTVFLCDKLIHASMIDGLKLGGANYRRWRHNDIEALEKLVLRYKSEERIVIVVESIYSMDGDIAPLDDIVELRKKYNNIILYVDEAHAFGVRGASGMGICEELGILDQVDIVIGTFGKATASAGAFVATDQVLKDYFLNCCRSFIFSTAIPPINVEWTCFMICNFLKRRDLREHLMKLSARFKVGLERLTKSEIMSDSQIIPLVIGNAEKTINISQKLSCRGVHALPIRRPTVAEGSERIRFSLSADLSEEDVDMILKVIEEEYEV